MAQVAVTKTQFQNNLTQTLEKDDKDCKILVAAYHAAATCAKKNTLVKEHVLEFDPDFFTQVEKGIADLKQIDRPILVIGETSAGKSSFLNLLIGKKVLPELTAPCTHCMCCIKKGRTLEARVSSVDGSSSRDVQTIHGNNMTVDQFRSKLRDLVNEDNCAQALGRCIDIFVPSDILEDNVYLVDTPGFGESAQVTNSLVRFLPKAIGIIFILNSTVSLGIAEDRGALILDEIKRLRKTGEIPSFDPSKMLFIANKWDQVEKEEREEHREKTIKKMRTIWPDFEEHQLLPLSVSNIRKALDSPEWVSEDSESATTDYKNVLDKIRRTVQHCASARSSVHSWYIDAFLKYLKTCLDAVENFSGLSSESKETKARILQTLIADLESTYDQEKEIIDGLRKVKTSLASDVHQHINVSANKGEICTWTPSNTPNNNDYSDVKLSARVTIRRFILKAISEYVEKWRSESGNLLDPLSELPLKIAEKEAKMEKFLKNIEKENVSVEETLTLRVKEETSIFNKKEIAAIVCTSPLWIPLGIAGAVTVLPVGLAVQKGKQHAKLSNYKSNTKEHLNKWTQQVLKNEYTLDDLEYIVFGLLTEKVNEKMDNFSKSIRKYKSILKHLDPKKKTKDVVRGYAEMRELCCHLDDLLPRLE